MKAYAVFLLVLLGLWHPASAQTPISTCAELQLMSQDLGDAYVLIADIDCTQTATWNGGEGFEPIGTNAAPFTGNLDGQDHTVTNLTINRPSTDYVGVFGYISEPAWVTRLNLANAAILGQGYVGGIAAWSEGTSFSHCRFSGNVTAPIRSVGSMLGGGERTVLTNCSASAEITSTGPRVGGLVGEGTDTKLTQCTFSGNVFGDDFVGGLIGLDSDGTIIQCHTVVSVTAIGSAIGGLAGFHRGTLTQSSAQGSVNSGDGEAGGLVGRTTGSIITQVFASVTVTSTGENTGGLIGEVQSPSTIAYAYSTGEITGTSSVGGLIGDNSGIVFRSYWDTQASTRGSSDGGTGKTTAQMYQQSTFEGWDFNCAWQINDGVSYPSLTENICTEGIIEVSNCDQLQTAVLSPFATIVLTEDIDCSATSTWDSGAGFAPGVLATGSLAGNGHTIFSLMINRPAITSVGLFGQINAASNVTHLTLVNHNIVGAQRTGSVVGSLNGGTLSHCHSAGNVSATGGGGGGIAGWSTLGRITQCSSSGLVTGTNYLGGIVGWNFGGLVSQCNASATIYGTASYSHYLGGLVGANDDETFSAQLGIIIQSHAQGSVTSPADRIGGLVGENGGIIAHCSASGAVTGNSAVGGLVGRHLSIAGYSFATGPVSGNALFGGLVGDGGGFAFSSYWNTETSGQITSASGIGKTTAQMYQQSNYFTWDFDCAWQINEGADYPTLTQRDCTSQNFEVSTCQALQTALFFPGANISLLQDIDCTETRIWEGGAGFGPGILATGSLQGNGHTLYNLTIAQPLTAGYFGLIAYMVEPAWVSNLTLLDVSITGGSGGSLLGLNLRGTVMLCHASGTVTGRNVVGGLIGQNRGAVSQCSFAGSVSGQGNIGGLIGYHWWQAGTTLTDASAVGIVTGTDMFSSMHTGGLIGSSAADIVMNAYAAVLVIDIANAGGLIGGGGGTSSNSYWDLDVSQTVLSAGGVGKSTRQLQTALTYEGWDFDNTWWVGHCDTYPQLRRVIPPAPPSPPVNISTCEALQSVCLDQTIYLAQDIDCTGTATWNDGKGFTPLGWYESPNSHHAFIGTLDGQGHAIIGLTITRLAEDSVALFGYTGQGARITNVRLVDADITGLSTVGMLVGRHEGEISHCSVAGQVAANADVLGGLVGLNAGNITHTYSAAAVTGVGERVGGLVGENAGHLHTSYAAGALTAFGADTGGLVGRLGNQSVVTSSYWDTSLSGHTTSAAGTGLATAQMQQPTSFADWDFVNTWFITPGCSYPTLLIFGTNAQGSHVEVTDCATLQAACSDQHLTLMNDINCAISVTWNGGQGFAPLGGLLPGVSSFPFTGSLDGQGYAIVSLFINRPDEDYVGVFGYTGASAQIGNVSLVDATIHGRAYVGGIAGWHEGVLSNVIVDGEVTAAGDISGGIAGLNTGTIVDAHSDAQITGLQQTGGIAGNNTGTLLRNNATGSVQGTSMVGGIAGDSNGHIVHCAASTSIDAETSAGGLVGKQSGTLTSSTFTGVLLADDFVGGAVGENSGEVSDIVISVLLDELQGRNTVGGIAGRNTGRVLRSQFVGVVSGQQQTGGLAGENQGLLESSQVNGTVSGQDSTGGAAGLNQGTIVMCAVHGEVIGQDATGGLVGYLFGDVLDSYTLAAVSGQFHSGGLIGRYLDGTLAHCFAAACVRGQSAGGLSGSTLPNNAVQQCYWDSTASGQWVPDNSRDYALRQQASQSTHALHQPGTFGNWNTSRWVTQEGQLPYLWHEAAPGVVTVTCPASAPLYQNTIPIVIATVGLIAASSGAACFLLFWWKRKRDQHLQALLESPHLMHQVAGMGDLDIIKALQTNRGRKTDTRNDADETPLVVAARSGHADVASYLLTQAGGDNADQIKKAAIAAGTHNHFGIVDTLPRGRDVWNAHQAATDATEKETPRATLLSEPALYGLPLDAVSTDGLQCTPLMNVIARQEFTRMKRMLDEGADPFVRSPQGHTALTLLMAGNHIAQAQLLVNSGPFAAYWQLRYALMCQFDLNKPDAAMHSDAQLMKKLLLGYPRWNIVGFILEVLERIATCLLLVTLLQNRESALAGMVLCLLLASYATSLIGMQAVRGHWRPMQQESLPYWLWLLTLPIISPAWSRLEWRLCYPDWPYLVFKASSLLLETLLPLFIAVQFFENIQANFFVLKLLTAPVILLHALLEGCFTVLWPYFSGHSVLPTWHWSTSKKLSGSSTEMKVV